MTVQNLYNQYLDGKITEAKFLYEVRRDSNLTMISHQNSFKDTINILKKKSMISEKAHKESTGKQEVEIIAKTIDMVNPYEYSRGMNYELDIMDVPAPSGDLSDDNVLKAQKKVLANLTKNPQYYFEKVNGKGEVSEKWVEATKKEIDKIGKGKSSKIIREGILEPGFVSRRAILKALAQVGTPIEIHQYLTSLDKSKDKFESEEDYVEDFKNYIADKSLEEHGQYADRVDDGNADSYDINEREESIYEKYSQKYGKTIDEIKEMVSKKKAEMCERLEGSSDVLSSKEHLRAIIYDDNTVGLVVFNPNKENTPLLQTGAISPDRFTYQYIRQQVSNYPELSKNIDNSEIDDLIVRVNAKLNSGDEMEEAVTAKTTDPTHNSDAIKQISKVSNPSSRAELTKAFNSGKTIDI